MAIVLRNIVKTYPAREGSAGVVRALDGVDLHVKKGEWLAVMGPSGSGKSTLMNLLGCLDRADSGSILINGKDLSTLSASELDRFRAESIGMIFQQFHLIPYLTALENVMLAQYFHSMTDENEAREALARVGLADRAEHLPAHLSGGEQQRVCIARALINDPQVILADEPTGNLDATNQDIVLRLFRDLHRQGRTIVLVTHDPIVASVADRRIELHHGRIALQEVYARNDEEQFDEVLEEIWVRMEHHDIAEEGRIQVEGALPMSVAVERMEQMGLINRRAHSEEQPHTHEPIPNRCHDEIQPHGGVPDHGEFSLHFTDRGRQRAEDVIRRHRLAERLFIQALKVEDEKEIEEQACKFEHILSPEVTDKICAFLGHPETCPHGSPIPRGTCCPPNGGSRYGK